MRSIISKQLSQRWTPGRARRCVVLASASPPPMRSFDSPVPSSSGSSSTSAAAAPATAVAAPAAPGDASYRSYRVSPWAAMKFNGPVPERVNGRLAMLAFLYIAQHEAETGQTGLLSAIACACSTASAVAFLRKLLLRADADAASSIGCMAFFVFAAAADAARALSASCPRPQLLPWLPASLPGRLQCSSKP